MSYSRIAAALHISKATCASWEQDLKDAISELKQEQLGELYESYYMTKEARIRKLGDTLERINAALDGADLTAVAPEKLLDYKLKYTEALKGEYAGGKPYKFSGRMEPGEIVAALGDLLTRIRAGETTAEQAGRESAVIDSLLRAYDTAQLKPKLDALEAVIKERR